MATRVALAAEHFVDHRVDASGESLRRRHDAPARERHVLPGPGLAFLIAVEAVDLRRQRTGTARRPQPHIDLIEHAVIGLHGQRADQALGQPGEILRAVERPLAVGIRIVLVEIVDHDQVEIGARGHLPGAEPAEREDRGLLAADAAVCGGEILFHFAVHRADEHVGKACKNLAGLLGRHRAGQDARADQEHVLLAEQADGVEHVFVALASRPAGAQARLRAAFRRAARRRNSARSADRSNAGSAPEYRRSAARRRGSAR